MWIELIYQRTSFLWFSFENGEYEDDGDDDKCVIDIEKH